MLLETELPRLHLGPHLFNKDLGALSYQEGLVFRTEEQSHKVDWNANTCISSLMGRGIVSGGLGAARADTFKSDAEFDVLQSEQALSSLQFFRTTSS